MRCTFIYLSLYVLIITIDLYGRGHSDNAKGHEHNRDLFTHQINELLSALGRGNDTFTLIGYHSFNCVCV